MTRPVLGPELARLAGCLATGLIAIGLTPLAGSTAVAAEEDTPLEVSVGSMSPSVIPRRGKITITGQVTNHSDTTWTDLNVYLLTSPEPFTTSDELEEASATDPALEIGGRLFTPGLYDEVGDLAPGSSTNYTLSVARKDLQVSGAPGVYWLAVHVLGANDGLRDSVADGRARTFIPLMERKGPSTTMSLVVPVKATVKRRADGRLTNLGAWQELLSPDGRLGRVMELSGASVGVPLTWVVDPAVLDAARSVAADNPLMDAGPTDTDDEPNTPPSPSVNPSVNPSVSPSVSPSPSPSEDTTAGPSDEEASELSADVEGAASWLNIFRRQSDQHTVLTTPYGDVDLAAMLRGDFAESYQQATDLGAATMESLDVDASPVVAPPSGHLPNVALPGIDPDTPLILGDHAAPEAEAPVVDDEQGHRIVLTDTSAGEGGPGPTPRFRALAVRQRILSEAAVHALSDARDEPLVVSTPQTWDPGSDWRIADFFPGFDVPWLRTVDVPAVAAGSSGGEYDGQLAYPGRERRAELPIANLLATQELSEVGNVYADLLTRNDTVDEFLAKSAMLATSYRVRPHPHAAVVRARGTTQTIRAQMEQVTINGPPFVTMSSEEGTFQVTIVNGLQEPVTVGIGADVRADNGSGDLVIPSSDPVSLGPGQRASVRLRATAKDIGVHSVTLVPTSPSGEPLGSVTKLNVRSSQVGLVIWVVMGLGATVLFFASGIRIVRRIRARKAAHGPILNDEAG